MQLDARGRIEAEWSSLINLPGTAEIGAGAIHGISRAMLSKAPPFAHVAAAISNRLRGRVLVGHVLDFDLTTLAAEFVRIDQNLPDLSSIGLCTRDIARRHWPDQAHNLEACCASADIEVTHRHTALGDARATAQLLSYFLARSCCGDLRRLERRARGLGWSDTTEIKADVLSRVLEDCPAPARSSAETSREGFVGRANQLAQRFKTCTAVNAFFGERHR